MKKLFTLFFALCLGAFASLATAGVGDVNADGAVNVSDVTALVNQIIGSGSYSAQACDVNADGDVNVSDVTALVNLIINGGGGSEVSSKTFNAIGVSFDMIAVEGGTFTMGATAEQGSDAYSDEKTVHQVTLSSYLIGKTEVTQELWQAVMRSNPSNFSGTNLPVERVSWDDCQTFISKLNELTGKNFRLPTEAEWEYAARGGNKSQGYKYSGSNTIDDVAWYTDNSSKTTHPVATKAPNELGIYDMSGNVYEWCNDWYGSYSSDSQINPTGPTSGSYRLLRGGCWNHNARRCRVSYRDGFSPGSAYGDMGFRLCLSE
ncbi:MAG: SUMF1/EgtB/PvdO family nonheme iron enzyme [Sodaliphilus sp.]